MEVTIKTSQVNLYATIERACIMASNACGKLDEPEKLVQILKLKNWASEMHELALTGGNPAIG